MRKILLLVLLLLTFSSKSVVAADDFVKICGGQLCWKGNVVKLKGFNYYPKNAPWQYMWPNWDENAVSNELQLARSYGANTIRVLVPYGSGWTDNTGKVNTIYLDRLARLISIANSKGIKVLVTLFDWYFDGGNWPSDWPQTSTNFDANNSSYAASFNKTNLYLSTIVNRLKDEKGVLAWDIKNEPDGGGFFSEGNQNWWKAPWVMNFLKINRDLILSIDNNHSVTIGSVSSIYGLFKEVSVGGEVYTLAGLSQIISFHDYEVEVGDHINYVTSRINNSKPILLEERGWPSSGYGLSGGWPNGTTDASLYNVNEQFLRIKSAFEKAGSTGISGVLVWEFFDHPNVYKFGIIGEDGIAKA